jgi:hypothetical protein
LRKGDPKPPPKPPKPPVALPYDYDQSSPKLR